MRSTGKLRQLEDTAQSILNSKGRYSNVFEKAHCVNVTDYSSYDVLVNILVYVIIPGLWLVVSRVYLIHSGKAYLAFQLRVKRVPYRLR